MTIEQSFIALIGLACSVLGWFARELYAAVQKLQSDLSALEIRIGTDYIRYDRLQDTMKPILKSLEEIKEALAHKRDKEG